MGSGSLGGLRLGSRHDQVLQEDALGIIGMLREPLLEVPPALLTPGIRFGEDGLNDFQGLLADAGVVHCRDRADRAFVRRAFQGTARGKREPTSRHRLFLQC